MMRDDRDPTELGERLLARQLPAAVLAAEHGTDWTRCRLSYIADALDREPVIACEIDEQDLCPVCGRPRPCPYSLGHFGAPEPELQPFGSDCVCGHPKAAHSPQVLNEGGVSTVCLCGCERFRERGL